VEELIRDGKLTEEQARVHPQRSIITRALGVDSSVEVTCTRSSCSRRPRDHLLRRPHVEVRTAGIADILRRRARPTAAANALVDAANAAGGEDNITVVVLDAVARPRTRCRARWPPPSDHARHEREPRAIEVLEPTAVGVVTTTTSMDAPTPAASTPEAETAGPPRDTARFP